MSSLGKRNSSSVNQVDAKLNDLKLIYKASGEQGLRDGINLLLVEPFGPQAVIANAETKYNQMQNGLDAVGSTEAAFILNNTPTQEEYNKLKEYKAFVPSQSAVYDEAGGETLPMRVGKFNFPDEEVIDLIKIFENRVIFLKYELLRRQTVIERKICTITIEEARKKLFVRPPDSQELNDFY